MFAGDERVIEKELVQGSAGVFEVELDHLYLVCEDVHWDIDAFGNSDELFAFVMLLRRRWHIVDSDRLEELAHLCVSVEHLYSEALCLHV